MTDRYVYPAIFTTDKDGVAVEFPDLPGCYTCGREFFEALDLAKEAAALHLYGMESDGEAISPPTAPSDLQTQLIPGQSLVAVEIWMPPIRAEMSQRAVKKTLTIPKWLNDMAEQHQINFSHVLQEALKAHMGIIEPRSGGHVAQPPAAGESATSPAAGQGGEGEATAEERAPYRAFSKAGRRKSRTIQGMSDQGARQTKGDA